MKSRAPYAAIVSARYIAVVAFVWDPLSSVVGVIVRFRAESGAAVAIAIAVLALRCGAASRAFAARRLVVSIGWLTAGLLAAAGIALWSWLRLAGEGVPRHTLISTIEASVLAGPVAQAAWAALLVSALWRYLRSPSDEGADQSAIVCATWVTVTQVARSWLSDAASPRSVLWAIHVIVPFALALAALARIFLRRRWLSEVAAGSDTQWALVSDAVGRADLPAATPIREGFASKILVRRHAAEAPFREAERLEPLARIGWNGPS
jgi:hypothetical protein